MPVITSVSKRPAWTRTYRFDFSEFAEVVAGETLSSPTVSATPTGLTIGSPSVSGSTVLCSIGGGVAGTSYTLTVQVTTSGGATLDFQGVLSVLDLVG